MNFKTVNDVVSGKRKINTIGDYVAYPLRGDIKKKFRKIDITSKQVGKCNLSDNSCIPYCSYSSENDSLQKCPYDRIYSSSKVSHPLVRAAKYITLFDEMADILYDCNEDKFNEMMEQTLFSI